MVDMEHNQAVVVSGAMMMLQEADQTGQEGVGLTE
jgi:hypothetical protein